MSGEPRSAKSIDRLLSRVYSFEPRLRSASRFRRTRLRISSMSIRIRAIPKTVPRVAPRILRDLSRVLLDVPGSAAGDEEAAAVPLAGCEGDVEVGVGLACTFWLPKNASVSIH